MCVRTSINFARVASSIIVADFAVVPLVPVGVGVLGDSPLTISPIALSIAATSVPQLPFDVLAFPVSADVAAGDEPSFSRFERCFFRSANAARFCAGTELD